MIRQFQHFINGHSTLPNSGEWIDSINPATGAVWAQIARGNKADVDHAVETALKASFNSLIGEILLLTGPKFCTALLIGWIVSMQLIEIEINDNEKRMREVAAQNGRLMDGGIAILLLLFRKMQVEELTLDREGVSAHVELIPYGVVGAITAWNSPFDDCGLKSCPRTCGRKCRIIKPSEMASASTVLFAELLA